MNPMLSEKCENFKIKSIQLFSAKKKKKINSTIIIIFF